MWCMMYKVYTHISVSRCEWISKWNGFFILYCSINLTRKYNAMWRIVRVCIIKLLTGGYVVVIGRGTWSAGFFFSFTMHWYCAGSENSININVVSLQKFCFTGLLLSCTVLNNLVLTNNVDQGLNYTLSLMSCSTSLNNY